MNKNNNGTILAQDLFLSLDTRNTHLNNNILLVGASGRGKTRNFIKPNIMQMNSNYIISDPKGVLITEIGVLLKNNGYKIKCLNLLDLKHSNTYNPFNYIKEDIDVFSLIDFIIRNTNPDGDYSKHDSFWEKSEQALLSALIFYLIKYRPKEEQNFTSIMKLLRAAEIDENNTNVKSPLDRIFDEVANKDLNSVALKQYRAYRTGAGKTLKSVLISLSVRLQYFNLDEYANLTNIDNIELNKIADEKTALFIIVSDSDPTKNWLAGIMYSQLFKILCERNTPCKQHIRFILDDFVCTGEIPDFDIKMSMIRSRNLSAIIVIQDEAQLEVKYGKASKGIISNCDTYVFLGSTNIDACNKTAERLSLANMNGNKIRNLPFDKCIVIYGNKNGIYKKYDLTKHYEYKNIPDDNLRQEYTYIIEDNFDVFRFYQNLDLLQSKQLFNKINYKNKDNFDNFINTYKNKSTISEEELIIYANQSKLKENLFDSTEESYFYSYLKNIKDVKIFPHQHLRDIFKEDDISSKIYRQKITNMHCDFIIRDSNLKILCGIEIDGTQHQTDEIQIENDKYKNLLFQSNNIPLYRFSAEKIRKYPLICVNNIINLLNSQYNINLEILTNISDIIKFKCDEGLICDEIQKNITTLSSYKELCDMINTTSNNIEQNIMGRKIGKVKLVPKTKNKNN